MRRILMALLVLGALRWALPRIRRFADPDPSDYGHPRRRNDWEG